MSILCFFQNNRDRKPPVTKQASPRSSLLKLVPLAAKHASPESAAGKFLNGIDRQLLPPLNVIPTKNFPSTGSPITIPLCSFQNSIASRNIPLVLFSKTT